MTDNNPGTAALESASPPAAPSRHHQNPVHRQLRPRRLLLVFLLACLLLVLGTVGWLGYRAVAAFNQISDSPNRSGVSGLWQLLKPQDGVALKGEKADRINVLFLGIGGPGHDGADLTDTIILASFQPNEGKVALISLPRDLYVPIPGYGWGKINSAHALGEQKQAGSGPGLAEQTIESVIGQPIDYYIRLDFQGFVKLVDDLGGLDITVEKAIDDPFFPAGETEGYAPFYLKAGPTHMDGALALKYARSRETTSDFDRSHRQEQLLSAMKEKGLSAGVLLNPKKMADILQILGAHVRTDLSAPEVERFVTLGKAVDTSQIIDKVYDTAAGSPLTSRTDDVAGYIIVPRAGNFGQLRTEIADIFAPAKDTAATIAIQNASGDPNLGGNVALLLRGYGYQVTSVTAASATRNTSRLWAADPSAFPSLRSFFKDRFGVIAEAAAQSMTTDFILVLGKDYGS